MLSKDNSNRVWGHKKRNTYLEKIEDGIIKEVAFELDIARIKDICKQRRKMFQSMRESETLVGESP